MANITAYLETIKSAIYGEQMRGAIHDSIKAVNDQLDVDSKILKYTEYEALPDNTKKNGTTYYLNDTGQIFKKGVEYGAKDSGDYLYGSKVGRTIAFSAAGAPLKSFVIDITPFQDTHGYGGPWGLNGSRNRVMINDFLPGTHTESGITITHGTTYGLAPGTFLVNGTATADVNYDLGTVKAYSDDGGQVFKLTGCPRNGSSSSYNLRLKNATTSSGSKVDVGEGALFTPVSYATFDGATVTIQIKNGTTLTNAVFKPMIRAYERYPSDTFYPNQNLCEFHDFNSVTLLLSGKNIFHVVGGSRHDGYIPNKDGYDVESETMGYYRNFPVTPSTTYTINGSISETGSSRIYLVSGQTITKEIAVDSFPFTFETDERTNRIHFSYDLDTFDPSTVQIEVGDSYSGYYAYVNNNAEISFNDFVFGCKIDTITGAVYKTWEYISSYSGQSLPGLWLSDRDTYSLGATPSTGAHVVYELDTPVLIARAPANVSSLKGDNTMYCEFFPATLSASYVTMMWEDIPKIMPLTQEQYDNLSEVDKMNGTQYFITDKGYIYLLGIVYGAGGGGSTIRRVQITERSYSTSVITVTDNDE